MTVVSLFPVLFAVLWATGFIGARLGMPYAEPMSFLALRFFLAFAILAILALIAGARWPKGRDFVYSAIVGALLHGAYLGGVFWAIDHGMPSGLAAMIVGLQPLLTALVAGRLLGETVVARHWLGLVVGITGLGMVLLPPLDVLGSGVTVLNIAVCGFSAVGATLGTIVQKRVATEADLRTGTCAQYVGAFIPCALYVAVYESFEFDWTGELILAMAWAVLVLSIGAIMLLMYLIRHGSVARLSSLFFLVPAIAALIAWPWFGETLSLIQMAGMALCALAVALVTRAGQRVATKA